MKSFFDEHGRVFLRVMIFLMCSVLVGGVFYKMKDVLFDFTNQATDTDTNIIIDDSDLPTPTPIEPPVASDYIATYNLNTDKDPIGKMVPETTPMTFAIKAGGRYSDQIPGKKLATAVRINHRFDGWYTNKTGGTLVTNSTVVDPNIKQNVTLYAHWTDLNYTMTLGEVIKYTGTPVTPTEFVKQGGKALTENTDFTASYEDNVPHDGEIYIDATAIATGKGEHPTMYLTQPFRVIRQDYKISYDMNTGTGNIPDQTKWWGIPLTLSDVIPTKTGWTFTKWNTKKNGSGTSYDSSATFETNAETVMYAQYRANTYKIVYDANRPVNSITDSSDVAVTDQTNLKYDTTYYFKTNTYRCKGYTAAGWNTKPDGSGTNYTPGTEFSNLTAVDNGTVTLYAQWVDDDPTIKITSISPEVYKADNSLNYTNRDVIVSVSMTDFGVGLSKLELIQGSSVVKTLATYNAEKEKSHNYTATFRIMEGDNYYLRVYDKLNHTAKVQLILPHIDKVDPEIIITD